MSGRRRAPSLPVGAAVTSRAAAEALGGGSSWCPSARRSPFSPLRSPSHFPRLLPRPRAAGGGGGRSCHGHQLGAAPRMETAAAATSLPRFPVALVKSGRGEHPRRVREARGRRPGVGRGAPSLRALPAAERGSRKSARAPLGPGERGDLGKPGNLSESRLPGLRNGDDRGESSCKRSLRRRFCLPPRTCFTLLQTRHFGGRNGMDK